MGGEGRRFPLNYDCLLAAAPSEINLLPLRTEKYVRCSKTTI